MNTEDYQVVRGEFFAHTDEPSLTFHKNRVYVNMVCLRELPQTTHVQFLIHPAERKLLLRPARAEDRDSLRWCTRNPAKRRPRKIPCPVFSAGLFSLLGWNPACRYRLLGRLLADDYSSLLAFDLASSEIFVPDGVSLTAPQTPCGPEERQSPAAGSPHRTKSAQTPCYPEEWQSRFGTPAPEHQNALVHRLEHSIKTEDPYDTEPVAH